MKEFREISFDDFVKCFKGVVRKSLNFENADLDYYYGMYIKDKGNTMGCPSRSVRIDLGMTCGIRCAECWNICLNTYLDENNGGFWNV